MTGFSDSQRAAFQARIERARDVPLDQVVGARVQLRKAGHEFTACCPFHDERSASFTVSTTKRFYHCFGCGAHGDAIKFLQDHDGLAFRDALQEVERIGGITPDAAPALSNGPVEKRESVRRPVDNGFVDSMVAGVAVWNAASHAAGTLVGTYLTSRGIDPLVSAILDTVRFHPRCPTSLWRRWEQPGDARNHAPAMLAPICRIEGEAGVRRWVQQGVHITFLAPDGRCKAKFPSYRDRDGNWRTPPSRKIWGDLAGACVPIAPRLWGDWQNAEWLGADLTLPLVVAEGLESTHSLREQTAREHGGGVRGACATLSLDNMQGRAKTVKLGSVEALPLHNIQPDLTRAVFTVPDAGAVVIGIDADMKGLKGRWVQERPRARAIKRDLTGAERSAICAALASGHWRNAGAQPVRVVRPPMGRDFNDIAMEAA